MTSLAGLTSVEVRQRVAAGQVNRVPRGPARTVGQIVRANTFTLLNLIIGVLGALIVVFGEWRDLLFVTVIVVNTAIGITQELRAKATLERLSVVSEARPSVRRDGQVVQVAMNEVVLDDVLLAGPGDQVAVDGEVLDSRYGEVDESLLTGEADPVPKRPGDTVLSGSFVVAGTVTYRATRVGAAGYAAQLAEQARRFTLVSSDLRAGINQILRVMGFVVIPVGVLLVISQLRNAETLADAVTGAVAGTETMIPAGLALLTSIAFAVGVIRLGQRNVLVQELPAIEGLARADVVCLDKTGTLTEPGMVVSEVRALDAETPINEALGALAAAETRPNPSLAAIGAAYPAPQGWDAVGSVPFSSARRWSGTRFAEQGSWVLGAADVLLPDGHQALATVSSMAALGLRILVLARASGDLADENDRGGVDPVALVTITQRVKPDAADTLRYFREQGVSVKVLSGDDPHTVRAVVDQLDVGDGDCDSVDGRALPDDPEALADLVETTVAFGRVTPHVKQDMVHALQSRGHTVAMTGDGVNDVLALKDADIGIAMASGSDATRGVAEIVLVDNHFEHLPGVVAEGRRVVTNIERVARLFLTKTSYATVISLMSGLTAVPFPFLPRHLTVVTVLTIGVPGFFLALSPSHQRYRPGFVRRVVRFAVPGGVVAGLASFGAYTLALAQGSERIEAQTFALVVLFGVAWWVLVRTAMPLNAIRVLLVAGMATGFVLVLALPFTREFFALALLTLPSTAAALGLAAAAVVVLTLVQRLVGPAVGDTGFHRSAQ